jgi:hypothetical protein
MLPGLAYRQSRRAQTLDGWIRLKQEMDDWFATNRDPEFSKRHGRQLRLLEKTISGALDFLRAKIEEISLTLSTSDFYRSCRQHELRLLWVRALWQYFKPKFDQREDAAFQRLLRAADEVVWACYAPAFEKLGQTPPPPPLPYIEPLFTPRAIPLDEPPAELKLVDAEFLKAFLDRLPIAVIGLPPACLSAPWWLAHIAHEAGHHLQHELSLVVPFGKALAQSDDEGAKPLPAGLAGSWALWGEEIFADAHAFLTIGPAASRALADVELSSSEMTVSRGKYPATVVRLNWQRLALDKWNLGDEALGSEMNAKLCELTQPGRLPPATATAWDKGQRLADTVLGQKLPLGDGLTIAELDDWEAEAYEANAEITEYASSLRRGDTLGKAKSTVTIRHLVAAGVRGWGGTLEVEHLPTREQEQKWLADALIENLIQHAPPGDRAAREATPVEGRLGEELGALLLESVPTAIQP